MDTTTQRLWEIINDLKVRWCDLIRPTISKKSSTTAFWFFIRETIRYYATCYAVREKGEASHLLKSFMPSLDKLAAIYDVTENDAVTMTKDIESIWSSLQAQGCRISDIEIQTRHF